jgi:DNA helicase II / ATP-dependent DNA helicase PcrA
MDLLNDLNEAQRAAVEYIDGPSLVIAGAGSGKTRVLTYKIAYLLSQGMKPWSIMALTFTNKAAREMKERIGKLVGNDLAQHLYMGTFHSIFSRILRAEAEHIGFNNNFTIYDESDSRSLIKAIVKEMGLDDKKYKPAAVHAKISMAKNNLMSAAAYESDAAIFEQNKRAQMPEVGKIFVAYVQRCKQANAMDFDDLLTLTYQLFREHEDIRHKYAARFDYVLVDEYQDTNHVQMSIVMQLCQEKQRVCAVGDDSQSIYSFRGANIDNILNYQRQFQGTRLFKLEQNYRSTQTIVEAANSLIKHNRNQIPKDVFSENAKGEKIQYKPAYSDKEEAVIVAKDVKRIRREDGCQYSDFAILYRTNAQSRSFEEEFSKSINQYLPDFSLFILHSSLPPISSHSRARIEIFTLTREGRDKSHLMFYLSLALFHISARMQRTEFARIRKRSCYQRTLATKQVFRFLVEMIFCNRIHTIDTRSHLNAVEINLHDALLAPHHFDEEGKVDFKSLAGP